MKLNNVILEVYNTSRATELLSVEGSFELTGTTRNNRLQLNEINTQKRYWIEENKLNEPIVKVVKVKASNSVNDPITYYTVSRGDTITTIANKFNTNEVCINALNGSDSFAIGQKIRVK